MEVMCEQAEFANDTVEFFVQFMRLFAVNLLQFDIE